MKMMLRNNEGKNKPLDFGILGKVKIGMKAPGKNFPTSLDYFLFTPSSEGGNSSYSNIADKVFPHTNDKKRNRLPIIFSSDSKDNIINCLELRDQGGKVVARTDNQTIEISITDAWESWYKANYQKVKAVQNKQGYYVFDCLEDFGEGRAFEGTFKAFFDTMETRLKKASPKSEWVEILKIRFVLVNFPVLGRWELTTKGAASSIGGLIDAYQAVQHARGSVVGVQWELKVDKVKSNRAGVSKQYSVLSLAPVLTAQDVNSGNLLLNSVNVHQNGLLLTTGDHHNPNPDIIETEFSDFEE